jgi:hypothetical protein
MTEPLSLYTLRNEASSSDGHVSTTTHKLEVAARQDLVRNERSAALRLPNHDIAALLPKPIFPVSCVRSVAMNARACSGGTKFPIWNSNTLVCLGTLKSHKERMKCIDLRVDSRLGVPIVAFQHSYGSIAVDACEAHELGDRSLLLSSVYCWHLGLATATTVSTQAPVEAEWQQCEKEGRSRARGGAETGSKHVRLR